MSGEEKARTLHFWSKIRQALKKGNLVEATEWMDSAVSAEGPWILPVLKERVGMFCRREIER